jgi:D-aminopeptidase
MQPFSRLSARSLGMPLIDRDLRSAVRKATARFKKDSIEPLKVRNLSR